MPPTYLHFEPWQWEWTVHWVLHIYFGVVGDELKKSTLNSEKKDKKIKIVSWNMLGMEERVRIQPIWDIPELIGKKKNPNYKVNNRWNLKKKFKLKKDKVFI